MTQATDPTTGDVLNRLDRLTTAVEAIGHSLQESKLEARVYQAETTQKLAAIDQRITDLDRRMDQRIGDLEKRIDQRFDDVDQRLDRTDKRLDTQEGRFWGFVAIIVTALIGLLGKLAFFPSGPV
ncbi:MAG: hypothetical protein IGQ88_12335 [Gloeomargaritaceae cyanobacterium C42_A2020_066]|nr:hypothetical protein [Gloeomargaritaceae cyanobacterium C42_A2020_066]